MAGNIVTVEQVLPSTDEMLEAALYPVKEEKPVIPTYAKFKELRARGANFKRFSILMHNERCRSVRLPAEKALKWVSPAKGFHFTDGPPHVELKADAVESVASESVYRCQFEGCTRFFDTEMARQTHVRNGHKTRRK